MALFISCDWGTSNFRMRVVDRNSGQVRAEGKSDLGIAAAFEQWRQSNQEERERLSFFQSLLLEQLQQLSSRSGLVLEGLPLILSGMASSALGMIELPYKELPLDISGHSLPTMVLPASHHFPHTILLVSGWRTADDVLRGEETQLIGCLFSGSPGGDTGQTAGQGGHIYIFPGTHSKHIRVEGEQIMGFTTYMTGELFYLLSQKSILAASVTRPIRSLETAESTGRPETVENSAMPETAESMPISAWQEGFGKGVRDSIGTGLLHSAFRVRTHQLFGHLSKEENYHYLSGLLIGEELKELARTAASVTLVGGGALQPSYQVACALLHITVAGNLDADQALINGHLLLYDLYKERM